MSLTWRILLALAAGFLVGALLAAVQSPALPQVIAVAEPVGGIWLNALRMTIIPLVFGLIVTGIASASDAAAAGAVTRRALMMFAVLLAAAGLFSAIATPALLSLWPAPADAGEAFRLGLAAHPQTASVPPPSDWFNQLVPNNPIAAAAEGAMLPLVIFAVIFGFAATRIEAAPRARLCAFFDAVVQTMLIIVHWVLLIAPIGVFALALLVAARAGAGIIGGLTHYVAIISILCIGTTLGLYLLIGLSARTRVTPFARAAWPAQAVAFSTQSSLGSLPAMVEGVRQHLPVTPRVSSLVLPLAVSLFRITSPAANLGVALYIAHLYGLSPSVLQIGSAVLVAAVVSLASVGLPSQVSFFAVVAPVCIVVGAPIEPLALLLAVESIPDIFRTVGNVTGDVAVTALVGSRTADEPGPTAAEAER